MRVHHRLLSIALFLSLPAMLSSAQAQANWQDFSITLLHGSDYTVDYSLTTDDSTRTVITMEYAAGYGWGDLFTFIDHLASAHHQELYWELQPRVALSPWFGAPPAFASAMEEYFIATALEVANFDDPDGLTPSSGSFSNHLLGVGASWKAPGFHYLHTNIYRAFNGEEDDDYQLTIVWAKAFSIKGHRFLYDGFIDWSSATADHHASLNWTSQLKHDIGSLMGKPNRLYWGIEYVYWRNKFGIANATSAIPTNERNINLLVKLHL